MNKIAINLLNAGPSAAKGAGRFAGLANKLKFKMPNIHPAVGESLIGSGVGGAYGYASTDESKGQNKLHRALAGAGLGAGAGAAIGHIGRTGMKSIDLSVNNLNAETAATAASKYEAMTNAVKPSTMADEQLYAAVYKGKTNVRANTHDALRTNEYNKSRGLGPSKGLNKSYGRYDYTELKSNMRNVDKHEPNAPSMFGRHMATDMANTEVLNNYRDTYTKLKPASNIHDQYKSKVFGGFRSFDAGKAALTDATKHFSGMARDTNEIGSNIDLSAMFSGLGFGSPSPLRAASHEQIEAMGKTQALRDRYNSAVRGATKDFRAGTKGKHFEDNFQQQTQSASHDIHLSTHQDTLGMQGKNFTTKKEVDKHIRNTMRTHHPDLGGDEAMFKKVNEAGSGVKNTSWYEKLASFQGKYSVTTL